MFSPLILDIDHSVGDVENATRLELYEWQEAIRFGCTNKTFLRFTQLLQTLLPANYGTVLLGSGDFHHLSLPLIQAQEDKGPFQVIICDNHPDNMRFPWGIHCGSWVRKVTMLPYVSHVHVIGITSSDISLGSAWEQYWLPLITGKLTYWCTKVDVHWAQRLGIGKAFRYFDSADTLIDVFLSEIKKIPTYFSIDKDVFSPDQITTNWDQGVFHKQHVITIIEALRSHIIASDITGEISSWRYQSWWKRRLSELDGQSDVSADSLKLWQHQQHNFNEALLAALALSSSTA